MRKRGRLQTNSHAGSPGVVPISAADHFVAGKDCYTLENIVADVGAAVDPCLGSLCEDDQVVDGRIF